MLAGRIAAPIAGAVLTLAWLRIRGAWREAGDLVAIPPAMLRRLRGLE